MEEALEQEKNNNAAELANLEKQITLAQNKRPDLRNRLEDCERKINALSDKEKQGNEKLIKKRKKWTQIKLAVEHLNDFIEKFEELSAEENKGQKITKNKFKTTVHEKPPANKKSDKVVEKNPEVISLSSIVTMLKNIKKKTMYWKSLYGDSVKSFNGDDLFNVIKKNQETTKQNTQSPKKKALDAGSSAKDNIAAGPTDASIRYTKTITQN